MKGWIVALGALTGVVAGVLLAPQPGRALRGAVTQRLQDGGRSVRGRAGTWVGQVAGAFHRAGNRLERVEHAVVRGTPLEPRVRAVFDRAEGAAQR